MPSEKIGIGPIDPHVIIYVPNIENMVRTAYAVQVLLRKKNPNYHVQIIIIPSEMIPAIEKLLTNREQLQGEYQVLKPFQKHEITDLERGWVYIKEEDRLIPLEEFLSK